MSDPGLKDPSAPAKGRLADVGWVVVGAGVVGASVAKMLAERGESVWLVEAREREGQELSSRNSGVVHAGLYYPQGSLKERLCIEGREALYEFAQNYKVDHRRCGKLVVARGPGGRASLDRLEDHASRAGVPLERLKGDAIVQREPLLESRVSEEEGDTEALWSPRSGIVDPVQLCSALIARAQAAGALWLPSTEVYALHSDSQGVRIESARGEIRAEACINAAGLGATRLLPESQRSALYLARGDWMRWHGPPPFRTLVYPARVPGEASLGIHTCSELDGGLRIGPDLRWVDPRPSHGPSSEPSDLFDRFMPALRALLGEELCASAQSNLRWDGYGLRPKLVPPGSSLADFEFRRLDGSTWHLLGIESPGLSACLAIASELRRQIFE